MRKMTDQEQRVAEAIGSGWAEEARRRAVLVAEPEAAPEPCEAFTNLDSDDPLVCSTCWWAYGAHTDEAGGPSGVGRMYPCESPDCTNDGTIRTASSERYCLYHLPEAV